MKKDKHPVIVKEAAVADIAFKDAIASESIDGEQSIVGWGSKPTIDRDKELIESSAWKLDNYRKNPVLLLCHKYDVPPVGKVLWVKSDQNGLKFKAKFANTERGKECYELYKDGIMNAFSVGFKPRPGGVIDNPTDVKYKGCKRVFTDVELMEISCVPVPANSDALVEHVKSGKIHTKQLNDELEFVLDIVEKAPACPVEGGKFGIDNGKLEECKDCKLSDACKVVASKEKEVTDVVEKIEVTENFIHVPAVGEEGEHKEHKIRTINISKKEGIQGHYCVDCKTITGYLFDKEKWDKEKAIKWVKEHRKDFIGNYSKEADAAMIGVATDVGYIDDDGDVVFGKREEDGPTIDMQKKIEELESIIKALEEAKVIDANPASIKTTDAEGMPSLYDLTSAVDRALNFTSGNEPVAPYSSKYVVDIFATQYPSGHVVYSARDKMSDVTKYFRVDYIYDLTTRAATISGTPTEVLQSWVADRYFIDGKLENDIEQKSDDVVFSKNKVLLSDCSFKMKAAVEVIDSLINIDEKENDEKDFIEIIEKEQDTFEIDDSVIEKKSKEVFEIDEETIKKAVVGAMSGNTIKFDTKGMITEIVAKLKGKATL